MTTSHSGLLFWGHPVCSPVPSVRPTTHVTIYKPLGCTHICINQVTAYIKVKENRNA